MKGIGSILGFGAVLSCCLAFGGSSRAGKSTQLEKALRLGKHWYGPERKLKDLEGRVVLFEFWGIS